MEEKILVSIVCLAYNHERYIKEALDSFLTQQTDFNYEVLVHDDASTDNTAKIIKEYELKYPNIIKPIYQTENQYSKGIKISWAFAYPKARGKYIALCEGDDFWVDLLKLQKQVDFLEMHDECSLCVHRAIVYDNATKSKIGEIRPSHQNSYFSTEQIILGDGDIFATNSMVFRKEFALTLPKFYLNAPIGDYPLNIYLSLCGKVYYFDDCMSAYRVNVEGSWTSTHKNFDTKVELLDKIEKMFFEINQYTNFKYSEIIESVLASKRFWTFYIFKSLNTIKSGKYKEWYKKLPFSWKSRIFIAQYFPSTFNLMSKMKAKIKG